VISTGIRSALATLACLFALTSAARAQADACRDTEFEGTPMTVCEADPASDDLRLWLRREDGSVYGTFDRVAADLRESGLSLVFAMNGGMYHDDRRPVGHFLDTRGEAQRVITTAGPGNFGLLPNAVFCIGDGWAEVIESRAYAADPPACHYASQSGPMLVIEGALHPRFLPGSTSRFVRNGVGVTADGRVVAAISNAPVSFHRFARFFRDALGAPNAMYFDGKVSRLYAPALGRHDLGFPMGPIFGLVAPED